MDELVERLVVTLVVGAAPAIVVLTAGLIVLIRRRAGLGRVGTAAVAGVAGMLAVAVTDAAITLAHIGRLLDGPPAPPWWTEPLDLLMVPVDLLALPLLAWAILARRGPRPAEVSS